MKNVILTALAGALAFAATPSTAHAEYGMAGCGLGSMVFKDDGFVQVLAAQPTAPPGNQTFSISSGTSNCEVSGNGASAALFIEANREADGAGKSAAVPASPSRPLHVSVDAQGASAMGSFLQSEYQSIFPSAKVSDKQVGMTIVTMLKDNDQLRCTALRNELGRPLVEQPDTSTPRGVGLPPPPRLCSWGACCAAAAESIGTG